MTCSCGVDFRTQWALDAHKKIMLKLYGEKR